MKILLRACGLGFIAIAAAPLFALSGSGDSAPGTLDTVAPTPGTANPPATSVETPIIISYSGATDGTGAGLASVELWVRTDTAPWSFTGLSESGVAGSFNFTPSGDPGEIDDDYFFTLVAEDVVGNRSTEPSGLIGDGDGATTLDTASHVADWMLLDQ
jgi:hypothetical protein